MNDRLSQLQELKIIGEAVVGDQQGYEAEVVSSTTNDLDFSGYGAFTPITIGSSTVFGNANLERD